MNLSKIISLFVFIISLLIILLITQGKNLEIILFYFLLIAVFILVITFIAGPLISDRTKSRIRHKENEEMLKLEKDNSMLWASILLSFGITLVALGITLLKIVKIEMTIPGLIIINLSILLFYAGYLPRYELLKEKYNKQKT